MHMIRHKHSLLNSLLSDILKDIVEKMSAGVLRPQPEEAVPLYEATVAMETVQRHQKKKAVVQL